MGPIETFSAKAPGFVARLMRDFELRDFQACGAFGNLGHECNGFTELHEGGQPEGRGGYGWGQWTGPRRRAFLNWCAGEHLDWRTDEANYGYLRHELSGDYESTISALHKCPNLKAAVEAFERNYERAGVVAMQSRLVWGQRALDAYRTLQLTARAPH